MPHIGLLWSALTNVVCFYLHSTLSGVGSRDLEIAPTKTRGLIAPYINHCTPLERGDGAHVLSTNIADLYRVRVAIARD